LVKSQPFPAQPEAASGGDKEATHPACRYNKAPIWPQQSGRLLCLPAAGGSSGKRQGEAAFPAAIVPISPINITKKPKNLPFQERDFGIISRSNTRAVYRRAKSLRSIHST